MGLFGKEDKSKDGSIGKDSSSTEIKLAESVSNQVATKETDIKANIQCGFKQAKDFIASMKIKSREWCDSSEIKQMNRWRNEFKADFCHPLGDLYRNLPEELTSFKFSAFGQYNNRERLFGLQAAVLFTAIATLRVRRNQLGLTKRFMLSIRNSTAIFLLGGLVVAPEIYNPLIKSDF